MSHSLLMGFKSPYRTNRAFKYFRNLSAVCHGYLPRTQMGYWVQRELSDSTGINAAEQKLNSPFSIKATYLGNVLATFV